MNTKQLLAAIALITVAHSALAEASYPPEVPFVSTKTRAEVKAELAQAKAQGLMTYSDADYPPLPAFVSTKTREQVREEAIEASKNRDENNLYRGH
jgi:hypothetical protein